MTSFQYSNHQDANPSVAWQQHAEHRSLRLFDFPRSRIPVMVDRGILRRNKKQLKSEENSGINFSRIPIPKTHLKTQKSKENISRKKDKKPSTKESEFFKNKSQNLSPPKIHKSSTEERGKFLETRKHVRFSAELNNSGPLPRSKRSVKLRGLELTSLPEDIFNQNNLETLILSPERESCLDFKLPFLPSAVGKLTKLRTLVLDTNELHDIPNEIEHLKELETLILGNNNLSTLPNGLAKLNKLKSLHLANNRFDRVPLVVCKLAGLRFLDLSDNFLVELPDELCRLAGTLQTLLLVMNQIEFLPDRFSLLTLLSCLWLGENNLRALPEDFGELFRLDWGRQPCSSNIEGNPLVHPPMEICRQGPLEIRKYFYQLKTLSEDVHLLRNND